MPKFVPPSAEELRQRGIDPKTMQPIKKTTTTREVVEPVVEKPKTRRRTKE